MSCTFQSANGCVLAAASNRPFSLARLIIWRRSSCTSSRAALMSGQTLVPTSMTAWCISGLTASCSARLALGRISEAMWERRSRVSGSMVWYSSSIPMLRLGRSICLSLCRPYRRFLWRRSFFRRGFFGPGSRFVIVAVQKRAPAKLRREASVLLGFAHRQLRHVIHNPIKIRLSHRVHICVGSRIHEVDGVGNAVLTGELDGVEVVTQRAAQRQGVALHPLQKLGVGRRRVLHVALVVRRRRIVVHDVHLLLPDDVAAKILFELDAALQRHAQVTALVIGAEELLRRVHLVHVLPAAAVEGLQERGKSHVAEDAVPRHGILQIAHGAVGGARRMFLVRYQYSLRNCNAQLVPEREVEELIVGAPPEWVVDDDGARQRRVLQVAAIKRDV